MKTTLILVIICLSLVPITEAKGHRMRSGLKLPRGKSKMGMGMGMGMGMPIFIPVVIPMGGYGRHRNSYRYGLQCYSCEGMDNDACVLNPLSISRRVTCPHNQYCSVLRRELTFQSVSISPRNNHTQSAISTHTNTSIDSNEKQLNEASVPVELDNPKTMELQSETKTITRVMISRGCKSPELHSSLISATNGGATKTYNQFCLTDFCNFGDGRLKCYDCEGEGSSHPCMLRPADVAEVVTCQPNEYCNINILRMTSINATSPINGTEVRNVSISRGCKFATPTDDDYDSDEGTSLLSLSCSSDLCNFVDGTYLSRINSASGPNSVLLNVCAIVLTNLTALMLMLR